MTYIVKNESVTRYDIVKVTNVTNDKMKKHIGVIGINRTQDYCDNLEKATEIVLDLIFHDDIIAFFNKGEVTLEVIGYFNFEDPNTISWDTIESLQRYPHKRVAENNEREFVISGNVSTISTLRFIQLTEEIITGYTTTVQDDKHNQNAIRRNLSSNSNIYFFKKIGEFEGKGIFRYASDMVVFEDKDKIDWILGVGKFEIQNHNTKISQHI